MNNGSCRSGKVGLRQRAIAALLAFSSRILHHAADHRTGEARCRAGGGADGDLLGRSFKGTADLAFLAVMPRENVLRMPGWRSGIVYALPSLRIFSRVFQTENRVLVEPSGGGLLLLITLSRRAAPPVLEDRQRVAVGGDRWDTSRTKVANHHRNEERANSGVVELPMSHGCAWHT